MNIQFPTISPRQLLELKNKGETIALLDVRSVDQYRAGHIPGAQTLPLDLLTPESINERFDRPDLGRLETLYLTCNTGHGAMLAAERLHQAGYTNVALIEGGTRGWQQSGFALQHYDEGFSLDWQVLVFVGGLLVLKVVLGFSVHELFFAMTAMLGIGLIVIGLNRWYGLARLIAHLPWNRKTGRAQTSGA